MDSTHVIAAGAGGVAAPQVASVLVYLSHWPLQPLSLDTAGAIAALLLAGGAMVYKVLAGRAAPVQEIKP